MTEQEYQTDVTQRPFRRRGLTVNRKFTAGGLDPYSSVSWSKRTSRITNPDGSVVFEMADAEIPATWSQVAADIMVSKYFRKAGVPAGATHDGKPFCDEHGNAGDRPGAIGPAGDPPPGRLLALLGREVRLLRHVEDDAQAFYDELAYMLVHQMAAPNSPQWFNTGLNYAYGITGPAQGHYYVDPADRRGPPAAKTPTPTRSRTRASSRAVDDDLVGEGGIMDLWVREARLFKYGSGTGTNFSNLRGEGEPLSGGGTSSGLMSFLRVGDRAAGAIKSGGTTRRAAKMVCLDVDHPDIETFINWKADEEKKVAALIEAGYPSDFNGEAYATVSGQNANNSVRVTNDFIKAVDEDGDWNLIRRTDGKIHQHRQGARPLAADRRRRLAVRRSGRAVRHHDQRVAHLPGERPHQRQQSVLRVHVPRQHGLQSGQPEPAQVRRCRDRRCRYRGLPARGPALDDRARDQRADGAVPEQGDRPAVVRLPHARSRLRQYRHGADDPRPALRLGRGPRLHQRHDRDHDRRVATRPRPRWRAQLGPFPGYAANERAHAAGDPQPPPRRLRRAGRASTRGSRSCRCRSIQDHGAGRRWSRPRTKRGIAPWPAASSTATATPRPRCSRQPARSVC